MAGARPSRHFAHPRLGSEDRLPAAEDPVPLHWPRTSSESAKVPSPFAYSSSAARLTTATRAGTGDALTRHVCSFAVILTERQDDRSRIGSTSSGRTTCSLSTPSPAVIAGLTLPWSSGAVEEHVIRIKMLKRQRFGRPGFALLRRRVLLAQ
ncbi:hypothetical protein [Streptomyces justiciae]|uniref:Transposase n=1 Tax=Streptomyces justiciae TaxID=2780140 RepID=A0ABU3LXC8_9ACTN|nr:hypothetical protein [Streptomyces justiciae]MDT7843394.1 hypothetical protein [Streptomyces justiciae]